MALNPYFKHTDAVEEQTLYHDLATEMVQMAGINVYYVKTDGLDGEFDDLFGENRFQTLDNSTEIEMYLKDMEKPYGGNDMFSKFGLTQTQTCTFIVAYRRFIAEFDMRPREGDYIYIPKTPISHRGAIFRITFVDVDQDQLEPTGVSLFFQIMAERAFFSHENVNTGVDDIDDTVDSLVIDRNDDTALIQELGDLFLNFDEANPFGNP